MRLLPIFCVVLIGTACATTAMAQSGCVSPPPLNDWWPGDGTGYNLRGTNHAQLINGAGFAPGMVGQAFSFDGVLASLLAAADPAFAASVSNAFTIEFWVNFNSLGGGATFIGQSEGPAQRNKWSFAAAGNLLYLYINGPVTGQQYIAPASFTPALHQWYHLAVSRDAAHVFRIYVNGAQLAAQTNSAAVPSTTAPFTIGQADNLGFLDGLLDEISIAPVALAPSALQQIYNAGAAGKCRTCTAPPSGMVSWWPANGNPFDAVGTNHAQLSGGAAFVNGWVGEAFLFDGASGYASTPLDVSTGAMPTSTWEAWVYPQRLNYGRQQILSCDDGGYDRSLLIEGDRFEVFTGSGVWTFPGSPATANAWQHVAVMFSPTNIHFSVNGSHFDYGSVPSFGVTGNKLNIGRNPGFGEFFKGYIDEATIYNRALAPSEIDQVYAAGHEGKCLPATSVPRIDADPVLLDFGIVTVGKTNALTMLVRNTGGATLNVSLAISNAQFTVASPGNPFSVSPGGVQSVLLRFRPSAATNQSGTLSLTHNDPNRPGVVVSLTGIGEAPTVCTPPANGLVSWWRAENYSAEDQTGRNPGVATNSLAFGAGKVGSAFVFDGNSYITCPTNGLNVGAGDFTIEGWVKTSSSDRYEAICSFDAYSPGFYVDSGDLRLYPDGGVAAGLNDGQFHHVAVVRTNGLITYYKDGAALGSRGFTTFLNATHFYIGWDTYPGEQFKGTIDELSFYNRTLSSNEVAAVFAAGSAGKCLSASAPSISVNPTNLDFGSVSVGQSNQLSLTVSNSGAVVLTVQSISANNPRFSLAGPSPPLNVATGTQQVFTVRFAPLASGTQNGLLSINSTDPLRPSVAVTLSGTGLVGLVPDIDVTPTNLNFGNVPVGQTNTLSLTISNVGASTLTVSSLTVSNAAFELTPTSVPFNIDPGTGRVVTVKFHASAVGGYSGALLIGSNDPDEPVVSVALAGTGLVGGSPNISVSPTNLNFGNVPFGQTNTLSLTISNAGLGTLTVSLLDSDNPAFEVVPTAAPFNVDPGMSRVVGVKFHPPTAEVYTLGTLFISSNDPTTPALLLQLLGGSFTSAPSISVSPTNLNFGSVPVGQSNQLSLTVSNSGTASLTVQSIATNNPRFSLVGPSPPLSIAPATQQVFTVRFAPQAAGTQNGSLSIASTDPNRPSVAVTLSGTGLAGLVPAIDVTPTNLNFGNVPVGQTNTLSLTLSNAGAGPLTVSSLTVSNAAFELAPTSVPFSVGPGTGRVVAVKFHPSAAAGFSSALWIGSNDPDEPVVSVPLAGAGLAGGPRIDAVTPTNTPGGATVTLVGANFGSNPGDVSVRFGGVSGVLQSLAPTQIVVSVPFGIVGLVSVTVTVGGQTSAAIAFGIQSSAVTQPQGRITSATLVPSNTVRLVIEPPPSPPNGLVLESADSPLGPWWKEPQFQSNPLGNGYEFFTPLKPYLPQQYYRFSLFSQSVSAVSTLPYIRFIAPNANVRPGLSVSLLGANFAPTPAGNTVRFELPDQSWTAVVTQAATNYLVATVPANLLTSGSSTGVLYRVTVSTAQGTGNEVGCTVLQTTANTLMVRPSQAYIAQSPGSGRQRFVVGGGVPPYHLVPQTTNDLAVAVATLNGLLLDVVAQTNTKFGSVQVQVQDSSPFPQSASASLTVLTMSFAPTFDATFHTLLAGSAPGLTMTVHAAPNSESLRIEKMEVQLQNAGIEVSRLRPGQMVALLKLFYSGTVYGFQHLAVKEVLPGRAKFDVISLADGGITVVASGELIENPPTMVINVPNLSPFSLTPQPLDQELIFADDLFRLPAGAGQSFSVTANFTSVSLREDTYLPQTKSVTRSFTNTVLATGVPRIDRLLPIQAEVNHNVRLLGSGFGATPADNTVTFTAAGGTNVPADILLQTNGELVVTVPRDAVSGPVRLAVGRKPSNDFQFYVRFHPDTVLLFNSFTNNAPTPLRLLHQQPIDDGETIGEVPLQSVLCTVGAGHIVVTNLSTNQLVGVALETSFYTGRQSTNVIVYAGRETDPPQRYLFTEVPNVGSSYVFARLYYSESTNGVTLELASGDPFFPFYPGGVYDFQFTTPIYRPPATPGADVAVRVETVSQQWISMPNDFLRLIVNSTRRVR